MKMFRRRALPPLTREQYDEAFETERRRRYPPVDAFEREQGYAVDRAKLEQAARVLACPVKPNPPCWQHGRVVYAVCRKYLEGRPTEAADVRMLPTLQFLDIGTAKGFSALCMRWAVMDSGVQRVRIASTDVLEPERPGFRNSIMDIGAEPLRLADYLKPWPEAQAIGFWGMRGVDWLKRGKGRINLAFIDGKHSTDAVAEEAALISQRQMPGDIMLFDDLQMIPVRKAVGTVTGYAMRMIHAAPERAYMLAVKR